jgi:hypothetical protein
VHLLVGIMETRVQQLSCYCFLLIAHLAFDLSGKGEIVCGWIRVVIRASRRRFRDFFIQVLDANDICSEGCKRADVRRLQVRDAKLPGFILCSISSIPIQETKGIVSPKKRDSDRRSARNQVASVAASCSCWRRSTKKELPSTTERIIYTRLLAWKEYSCISNPRYHTKIPIFVTAHQPEPFPYIACK